MRLRHSGRSVGFPRRVSPGWPSAAVVTLIRSEDNIRPPEWIREARPRKPGSRPEGCAAPTERSRVSSAQARSRATREPEPAPPNSSMDPLRAEEEEEDAAGRRKRGHGRHLSRRRPAEQPSTSPARTNGYATSLGTMAWIGLYSVRPNRSCSRWPASSGCTSWPSRTPSSRTNARSWNAIGAARCSSCSAPPGTSTSGKRSTSANCTSSSAPQLGPDRPLRTGHWIC